MAVSRVQGTTGSATGATTAVTITVTGTDLLTCVVQGGSTSDTLSASDGVNTWNSPPDTVSDSGLGNIIGCAYAMNAASGSTTITGNASASNAGHTIRIIVDEWSGVATTSALRDHGSFDNTAAITNPSVSTAGTAAVSGDLGFEAINQGNNTTYTASSWTGSPTFTLSDVIPAAPSSRNALAWVQVNTAGKQTSTISYSPSTSNAILVILIFAQSTGGAATPVEPPMRTLRGIGV